MADEDSRQALIRVLRDLFWMLVIWSVLYVVIEFEKRSRWDERHHDIMDAIHESRIIRGNMSQTTNIGVEQKHEIDDMTREILKKDGKL